MYLLLSQLATCYKNDSAGNVNLTFICTQIRMHSGTCLERNERIHDMNLVEILSLSFEKTVTWGKVVGIGEKESGQGK